MNIRAVGTLILLVGAIAVLQFHSIQFWAGHVDATTGLAWSLLLELASLWLWFSPSRPRRLLGAVATVLLVSGPLYVTSAPIVQEWQAEGSSIQRRAELQAEIASAETALSAFLANSQQRVGWAGRIDAAQTRLDAARAELAGLTRAGAKERMDWQRASVVAMQVLAILLMQLTAVLCIGELRQAAREPAGAHPEETETNPQGESAGSASQGVPRGMRRLHRPTSATPEPLRAAVA